MLGFEGFYEVSSKGRVRSLDREVEYASNRGRGRPCTRFYRGCELTRFVSNSGYLRVKLTVDTRRQMKLVHRLVCEAFHGPAPLGHYAAHGDGDKLNNDYRNLRWATPAANTADRWLHGTLHFGEKHNTAKLSNADVRRIRQSRKSSKVLARQHGVTHHHINRIRTGAARPVA